MSAKNPFWDSEVYKVIVGLKRCGNQPGMVATWIASVAEWAERNAAHPDARAINGMLPLWRARPFYSASELAPIIPALALAFGISEKPSPAMTGARLQYQLEYGGLPKLRRDNGTTFFHDTMGVLREYFIVEHIHKWAKEVLSQEEFDNVLFD